METMNKETAIEILERMMNEEAAFAVDLNKEGQEESDRFIKAMDLGVKALEQSKYIQNRCFALTLGCLCANCGITICERRVAEYIPIEEDDCKVEDFEDEE